MMEKNTFSQNLPPDAKAYFDSLPPMLQETVMQSGAKLTSKADLESFCKNTLKR